MKKMLIIKAADDIHQAELLNVASQLVLYGINYEIVEISDYASLYQELNSRRQFDYIYLATHGCETSFGNIAGTLNISWTHFAAMICESAVAKEGAVFMHSCCRGGLQEVAWQMFGCCQSIQHICGPSYNISPVDLVTSFNMFLFYIEKRSIDPVQSAIKAANATDIRLVCYDRTENARGSEYKSYCDSISLQIRNSFEEIDRHQHSLYTHPIASELPTAPTQTVDLSQSADVS